MKGIWLAIIAAFVITAGAVIAATVVLADDVSADSSSAHWVLSNGSDTTVEEFGAANPCLYSVWNWDGENQRWTRWYNNLPPGFEYVNDFPDAYVLSVERAYWFAFNPACEGG